ncbi:hypothetical protein Ancab_037672 [Ancistrocladus abbreviatus]
MGGGVAVSSVAGGAASTTTSIPKSGPLTIRSSTTASTVAAAVASPFNKPSSSSSSSNNCLLLSSSNRTSPLDAVLSSSPSRTEVENAFAAFQSFMRGLSLCGTAFGWLEPVLSRFDPNAMQSPGLQRVRDALHLLLVEPSFQTMVISIASDQAVWDAVQKNKVVQELQRSVGGVKVNRLQGSQQELDLVSQILRWILDITKAKVVEIIDKLRILVDGLFEAPQEEKTNVTHLEEMLRSSVLLSIIILLIVVVTRANGA